MGTGENDGAWLGLERTGDRWSLRVHEGLQSGAGALFGGCATGAAVSVAQQVADQPVIWASAHFGALARLGTTIELSVRAISTGRTMTHLEVRGVSGDREAFTARVAAGDRPPHDVQGHWAQRPDVPGPDESLPFAHPVHEHTWADRFEWRLAASSQGEQPSATWWVRTREPMSAALEAAVLGDYITYGIGRALAEPMGGLSIDNVLRIHNPTADDSAPWRLLHVQPESISGGFGYGHARLFDGAELVASASQSVVMNGWDWRLPSEQTTAQA